VAVKSLDARQQLPVVPVERAAGFTRSKVNPGKVHHAITGHLACCTWDQTQNKPENCFGPAGVALMHSLAVGAVNAPSAVTAPMRFYAPAVDEHLRVALHRLREHRQRPRPVALNLLCLQLVHSGVLCRVSHFDGAAADAGALPSSSSQRPVRQVASFKSALQSDSYGPGPTPQDSMSDCGCQ